MAPRIPARCWAPTQRSTTTALLQAPQTSASLLLLLPTTTTTTTIPQQTHQQQQTRGYKVGWNTLDTKFEGKSLQHRLKYNSGDGVTLPKLTTTPAAAQERKSRSTPLRTGVLAYKMGMTGYYTRNGKRFPCTVLQMEQCQVVAHKTLDTHGYAAVQIGCGERRADNVPAPQLGYYEAKGIPPKAHLVEFQVRNEQGLAPAVGCVLMPDWFHKGQWVDVRGNSRGMGFQGGMKRHGFSGQEASHGNSKNHRTPGSSGASQGSGSRVLPGKKMPGRMGNERVTVQNLPVLRTDNELGIIVVKGCVAGPKGQLMMISDAVKKPPPPEGFIDKMNKALAERFPHAERDLEAARQRHLEMKEMRKARMVEEFMKKGIKETESGLVQLDA